MFQLPKAIKPLSERFAPVFNKRTFPKMQLLAIGAILTLGRRTFTRILVTLTGVVQGHFSSFYRVFSRSTWSCWKAGRVLATVVIETAEQLALKEGPVVVLTDSTVSEHPGRKVYGKGKHRDAVRSSHSYTAWRWGLKWVVLAIAVPVPLSNRRWALPVLVALYRNEQTNEAEGRRHKTQGDLAQQLMRVLLGWFPEKQFVLVGDGDFSSHAMGRFVQKHRRRLTFVGKFYADAALYDPPPSYSGKGRPRVKGARRPRPEDWVAQSQGFKTQVDWYGGARRKVELIGGTGHWYKSGAGLVSLRWVYVEDREGTHRPEYFFSTDPSMPLVSIVGTYTTRWTIEVTFQEVRAQLGFESTRHRTKKAIQRVEPWLLALYSVVTLVYIEHQRTHTINLPQLPWYQKSEVTFADALVTVRRLIWTECIFEHPAYAAGVKKLGPKIRDTFLNHLTQAA